MTYIATIDTEPPRSRDFEDAAEAEAWARRESAGAAWVVGEAPADPDSGPPRIVASGLPTDL